jgi:cyanophycinase
MSGWFALLGSGEFMPWTREIDAWMLERVTGDGRVVVIPTASAPEGDHVFLGWARSGVEHFGQAGVPVEVLEVRDRTDADDRALAERVEGASLVYFSGGNPAYLARTLQHSALWREILNGLDRGMGYIGCSAGMACLGRQAPDSSVQSMSPDLWAQGLGVFGSTWFGPHWDVLDRYAPGLVDHVVASVPPGDLLVGVDEQTALVGDGDQWQVVGRGAVHVRAGESWQRHAAPGSLSLTLRG